MKKLTTLLLVISMLFCTVSHAKIRRVGGNPGNPVIGTDYTGDNAGLNAAINDSNRGDTIFLYPGTYGITLSKKLVIIGPGYFINTIKDSTHANAGLQNIVGSLNSLQLSLNPGSDSSIFLGIDSFMLYTNCNSNNIIINRCNVSQITSNISNLICQNWNISQSILNNFYLGMSRYSFSLYNGLFCNCLIVNADLSFSSIIQNCMFINNIFSGTCNLYKQKVQFINNIFLNANLIDFLFSSFQNNISTQSDIPAGTNKLNVSASSIFVGYPTQGSYSNDARYKLSASSPAKGFGVGGVDCGMFGGSNPYVLSGIPSIPAFYYLSAPSINALTNPYTITFSVRSNN